MTKRACSVPGCGRRHNAQGLCTTHYARALVAGEIQPRPARTRADYFWDKVEKTETCWLWTGRTRNGYGRFDLGRKAGLELAHLWLWEQTNGTVPAGLEVFHTCGVALCVNPEHLFLGTQPGCACGCGERPGRGRQFVDGHNLRVMAVRAPVEERFWSKVQKGDGCWIWTARTNKTGYGKFARDGDYRPMLAHRIAWELTNGPIPAGLLACHHCDNPPCVRPDHLFLGTHADNMRDMVSKGRQAKRGARR